MIHILTLWNKPDYVKEAIASVQAQTRRDFVHIVQPDTYRGWRGRYPPAVAYNEWAREAPMEDYISWLSDDDLLQPNYVADLAGCLDVHPEYECVYGQSRHVMSHPKLGERFIRNLPAEWPLPVLEVNFTPGYRIDGGQFMIRRSALERIPYPYYGEGYVNAGVCDADYMNKIVQHFPIYPVQKQVMVNRMTPLGGHVMVNDKGEAVVVDWKRFLRPRGDVTAVIVSLNTYELTRKAADSLVTAYPDISLILIDQASIDATPAYLQACSCRKETRVVSLPQNIGHGPALHMAAGMTTTPYLFTMDSDCEVKKPGFLELMTRHFDDGTVYAVGDLDYVRSSDGRGNARVPASFPEYVPYVHPYAGLYRLSFYKAIRPFAHHGAPALYNMVDARAQGWKCVAFPIQDYVSHLIAGTRRMYPSARGNWNPLLGQLPIPWKK